MPTDELAAMRELCENMTTDETLAVMAALDDHRGVAFAVAADVLCRRWQIDGRPLAAAIQPLHALRMALATAGYIPGVHATPL